MTPLFITTGPQQADGAGMAQHRKLVDAAQSFEAMFLNEMLKGAFAGDDTESDKTESGGGSGTMQGLGSEAVAKAIAAAGGMGIARHIVAEVEAEHARREGPEKSGTPLKSLGSVPIKAL